MTAVEALGPLARARGDAVVVTTMSAVRPWAELSDHPLDFASADSAMGHAADLALGIALARPRRRVFCVNGDGSMLMTLGTLVTIAAAGASNLLLVVLQNGVYEVTGNQPVPGAGQVDYPAMARAAGFPTARSFADAASYAEALPAVLAAPGPTCISLSVAHGGEQPLSRGAGERAAYLRPSLAESARALRRALAGR